jgi:hypothetical protein
MRALLCPFTKIKHQFTELFNCIGLTPCSEDGFLVVTRCFGFIEKKKRFG